MNAMLRFDGFIIRHDLCFILTSLSFRFSNIYWVSYIRLMLDPFNLFISYLIGDVLHDLYQ